MNLVELELPIDPAPHPLGNFQEMFFLKAYHLGNMLQPACNLVVGAFSQNRVIKITHNTEFWKNIISSPHTLERCHIIKQLLTVDSVDTRI